MFWYKFPVINDCGSCGGTGIKQWHVLDGGPMFYWIKTAVCEVCRGVAK